MHQPGPSRQPANLSQVSGPRASNPVVTQQPPIPSAPASQLPPAVLQEMQAMRAELTAMRAENASLRQTLAQLRTSQPTAEPPPKRKAQSPPEHAANTTPWEERLTRLEQLHIEQAQLIQNLLQSQATMQSHMESMKQEVLMHFRATDAQTNALPPPTAPTFDITDNGSP